MKSNLVVVVLFLMAELAFSQTVPSASPAPHVASLDTFDKAWTLGVYAYDEKSISQGMLERSKEGFYPVALDISEGPAFMVMYLKSANGKGIPFNLIQTDIKRLPAEIASLESASWYPMDICFKDKVVWVLSIKDETMPKSIPGQLSRVPADVESVKKDMVGYSTLGYIPYSISYYDHFIWIAYMKDRRSPVRNEEIAVYANDGNKLFAGIDFELKNGYRPWGFTVVEDKIWVLYVQ